MQDAPHFLLGEVKLAAYLLLHLREVKLAADLLQYLGGVLLTACILQKPVNSNKVILKEKKSPYTEYIQPPGIILCVSIDLCKLYKTNLVEYMKDMFEYIISL